MDVEQGNIIDQENVARLHRGMSTAQVKAIMGQPVLINLFTPQQIYYVYTLQRGHDPRTEKRVIVTFRQGRLVKVE